MDIFTGTIEDVKELPVDNILKSVTGTLLDCDSVPKLISSVLRVRSYFCF